MNCRQAQGKLDLYLDGHLPPKQRWELEAHLGHCLPCHQAWLALRQASQALERLGPDAAPGTLLPRVMAAVAGCHPPGPSPMARWAGVASWAMGLLGSLVGLALLGLGRILDPEVGLPQSAFVLAQAPDLAFDSLSSSLGVSLDGLASLVDRFLLDIPDLEASLLLGGCLLLLSTGGLILQALGQPRSARGGLAPKGGI